MIICFRYEVPRLQVQLSQHAIVVRHCRGQSKDAYKERGLSVSRSPVAADISTGFRVFVSSTGVARDRWQQMAHARGRDRLLSTVAAVHHPPVTVPGASGFHARQLSLEAMRWQRIGSRYASSSGYCKYDASE
jgi:hypothetical protein